MSFEQGATIPSASTGAAFGLYGNEIGTPPRRVGAGLTPPWKAGGRGKYSGEPILVIGGSSALGQQG